MPAAHKGASDHLSGARTPVSVRPHHVREDRRMRLCPRCEDRSAHCALCDGTGEVSDTRWKIYRMKKALPHTPKIR